MAKQSVKQQTAGSGGESHGSERAKVGSLVIRLAVFVGCLMLLLSLLPGSYDPLDWDILAGGIGTKTYPRNWVGVVGVVLSHWLLLLFGFSAYPVVFLLFLASARRLLWRRGLRLVGWDYWVGLLLTMLGGAMLLGIWPGLCADWGDALNLGGLPGGVIGQRLCAPADGLMRTIFNAVGSAIVSSALLLAGLIVVWVHDWHNLARAAWRTCIRDNVVDTDTVEAPRERGRMPSPMAERRRLRMVKKAEKSEKQQELALPAEPQPPSAEPVAPPVAAPATGASGTRRAKNPKAKPAYVLPGLDLLNPDGGGEVCGDPAEVEQKKVILQETLDAFAIDAEVGGATSGPRVTLYEVLPAPGVKVEKISRLSNNICMDLRATSIRILTPIPGRKSVGIEVPNAKAARVSVRNLMDAPSWRSSKAKIPLLVGRSISGDVVVLDLAKAPHLLIAGATGSGKSVCINLLIMSLLYRFSPDELRLIMVDPKVVEFRAYEALPHLITPVISHVEKVPLALRWVLREMERRYRVLARVNARNIETFNTRPKTKEPVMDDHGNPIPQKLPYIVVIIDELADIMMTAKGDVETALARLAQMSRAVGIHAILATQRPSVNVITGIIKANFPTRIAFKVTSQVDSRTILDSKGAEALLGQGDMLFRPPGASGLERNQGGLVEDPEIERVVSFTAAQAEPEFDESVFRGGTEEGTTGGAGTAELSADDEALVGQAIEIIMRDRRATTSYLQRTMRIGYNRAASIIDILEERGIIGPQVGTVPREILVDPAPADDNGDDDDLEPDGDPDGDTDLDSDEF